MRPANKIPSYLKYRDGKSRVVIRGQTYYLGEYNSPESRAEYGRLIAEFAASNGASPLPAAHAGINREFRGTVPRNPELQVNSLIERYMLHAEQYYRKNGQSTSQLHIIRQAMRPVCELYGHTLAVEFGPLALAACRQKLIEWKLARSTINNLVGAIRLMFRWAASQELLPGSIPQALATLPGLRKGRSAARETNPIGPVHEDVVEQTLEHVPPAVAAMVRLQSLCGCRPGEIVIIRGCDLNTSAKPWEYIPTAFKTEHHEGRRRIIRFGPQAREILNKWLKTDLGAYLFSPRESEAAHNAERRAQRETPLYPSHQARYAREKKKRGRRAYNDRYDVNAYRRAITRACDLAFPHPVLSQIKPANLTAAQRKELAAWREAHRWHPNQLRHSAGTKIRRQYSVEHSAAVLGHADLETNQIYSERDAKMAEVVMEAIG
jgi:integrase